MADSQVTRCKRCDMRVRVNPKPDSQAGMLRRAQEPTGLCINCAVHDWLRNTYPVNILLAESGPKGLMHVTSREQFAEIMRVAHSDAVPDEINWNLIVENWDLPFPTPVKARGTNPVDQKELDRIAAGGGAESPKSPNP